MLIKSLKLTIGLWLILTLLACGQHMQSVVKAGEMSRDTFISSMRWKRYNTAASLIQKEFRQEFKETFTELKDLQITNVELIDLQEFEEGRRFETTIEIEYYLLPSVTLKTFRFDQTWQYFDDENDPQQGFQVITPFPEFP